MKNTNRKFVWLILSLFVFLLPAMAQNKTFDQTVLSESGKQAYQTLLKIKLFAIGGIGYGGETSEGEKVFDILLEEKEAISAFKSLVRSGTIEGGMYGLFGLKMTDCNCFQQEFTDFKKSRTFENNKEAFASQAGCSFYQAETNPDKDFAVDYIVSKGFDQRANWKKGLRKQREILEKQKQENSGVKKNQ